MSYCWIRVSLGDREVLVAVLLDIKKADRLGWGVGVGGCC